MLTSGVFKVLNSYDSHTPLPAASGAVKVLNSHDLHTPPPAVNVNVGSCLPKSEHREEEDDDDEEENISDSSLSDDGDEENLSDDHSEEDPVTGSESEDSEQGDDGSKTELEQPSGTTTQSDSNSNKKRKSPDITYPEEDEVCESESEVEVCESESEAEVCETEKPAEFPSKFHLLSKCVPWLSKSSDGECSIPDKKEDWISSWFSENGKEERKGYHYLNVYGFYKKKTEMGGYGVILRDPCGKPVIASASVQVKGKSYFHHVLDGVKAGLELARNGKIYDLKLICNSETLEGCLSQIFQIADDGERETSRSRYRCGYCRKCLRYAILLDDKKFEGLFPLLVDIIRIRSDIMCHSHIFRLQYVNSDLNLAAYHLAEQCARKIETEKPLGKPLEIEINKLADFENELKEILWNDAYGDIRMYSQLLQGIRL